MKEILDIRVPEQWAKEHLGEDVGEGVSLLSGFAPFVRRLVLEVSDPLVSILKKYSSAHFARTGIPLFWPSLSRQYEDNELEKAVLFRLRVNLHVDTYGEEHGTKYDKTHLCARCGYGALQVGRLIIDQRSIPRQFHIAVTLANELIVSARLADCIVKHNIGECLIDEVEVLGAKKRTNAIYQLRAIPQFGTAVPPSRFGLNYFHDDPEGHFSCIEHEWAGLNLISELFLTCNRDVRIPNVFSTNTRIGKYAGQLVPHPILCVSQRMRHVLLEAYKNEASLNDELSLDVAHMVEEAGEAGEKRGQTKGTGPFKGQEGAIH